MKSKVYPSSVYKTYCCLGVNFYEAKIEGKWWNGLRDRLKICWPQGHEGSTPSLPRNSELRVKIEELRKILLGFDVVFLDLNSFILVLLYWAHSSVG